MAIFADAVAIADGPDLQWIETEPPRFDDPANRPLRTLCRVEELETWEGYGKPLVGVVIRDTYLDHLDIQVVVTPTTVWTAEQIHARYRCRWDLEETYLELMICWRLGEIARRTDSYRVLVALMVLLYALIELFQATGAENRR